MGDLDYCRMAIAKGSVSFHAASRLLPRGMRDPAVALYAFCRVADDNVDLSGAKIPAVLDLQRRLDLAYAATPEDRPMDRAFARMVAQTGMPRALPEALLEGLAWDADERRYKDESALYAYCARVASAVGVMMCVLMGVRNGDALARACDLGVAMQLTNIARDIGEDARAGRIYVPLDWLGEVGLTPEALLALDTPDPRAATLAKRLLSRADALYLRADAGISALPHRARLGIYAARYIYRAIGGRIAANGYDSVTQRAYTGRARKLALLGRAAGATAVSLTMP
ncbi:MAG: phytoene/squalene synthase family protein, partial [Pseudomonadota bacterium]